MGEQEKFEQWSQEEYRQMNTFQQSEQVDSIAAALAEAQGQFAPVLKDSDNPYFKSKYADLATIIEATRPALSKNGLALVQGVSFWGQACQVITTLMHSSGQWMRSVLWIPVAKMDAQGCGSASTYGRRYGAQAMLNVAGEDDDGNAASGKENKNKSVSPKVITKQQVDDLRTLAKTKNRDEVADLLMRYGCFKFSELSIDNHDAVLQDLRFLPDAV